MTERQRDEIELDYANWLYEEGKRYPDLKLREIGGVVRKYENRKQKEWKELNEFYSNPDYCSNINRNIINR